MPRFLLTNEVITTSLWKMLIINPSYSQDISTKVRVGTSPVCTYFRFIPGIRNSTSGDFPPITSAKTGWRTERALNGYIQSGIWTFKVAIRNDTNYGFNIRVDVRISKSSNADGSYATLIALVYSPNVIKLPPTSGTIVTDTWTWSGSLINFSMEYLFVEYRLHIQAAGTSTICQCSFVCDENPTIREESVTTPTYFITKTTSEFPMSYLPQPVKAKELRSKVDRAMITKVSNDFPLVVKKKGSQADLASVFE